LLIPKKDHKFQTHLQLAGISALTLILGQAVTSPLSSKLYLMFILDAENCNKACAAAVWVTISLLLATQISFLRPMLLGDLLRLRELRVFVLHQLLSRAICPPSDGVHILRGCNVTRRRRDVSSLLFFFFCGGTFWLFGQVKGTLIMGSFSLKCSSRRVSPYLRREEHTRRCAVSARGGGDT
jgi:hypothetical protein